MDILMSAFSCAPTRGSEPGIGWNWAVETARLGHNVLLLTTTEFESLIREEAASNHLPPNLEIEMIMPSWLDKARTFSLRFGFESATWLVVHLIWQMRLPSYVRRHYPDRSFDVVHHVTIGSIRHPTCLYALKRPLVIGPIGGGESSPPALRKGLHWKARMVETVRDFHNWLLRFDPISRTAYRNAMLIVSRTSETTRILPKVLHHKIITHVGIGTHDSGTRSAAAYQPGEQLRLIYAGRLLAWKGVHFALMAIAQARAKGVDVTLTLVGEGPYRSNLLELANRLGIFPYVKFLGAVPRARLLELYADHHALLFPSLHDSGGMVILESFSRGLPVICLSLGGPGEMVDPTCGRVVAATGDEALLVADLAASIDELASTDFLYTQLSEGALARSREYAWPKVIAETYREIEQRLRDLRAG
jgi:glycosyltransferase involved in cell wall biosynthesis